MATFSLTLRQNIDRKLTTKELDDNFLYVLENSTGGGTGPQGPIGSSFIGPQGFIGLTGSFGSQGYLGVSGPEGGLGLEGEIGLTGPVGSTGSQGGSGPIGFEGFVGNQGLEGFQGNTFSLGVDEIGFGSNGCLIGSSNLKFYNSNARVKLGAVSSNNFTSGCSSMIGGVSNILDTVQGNSSIIGGSNHIIGENYGASTIGNSIIGGKGNINVAVSFAQFSSIIGSENNTMYASIKSGVILSAGSSYMLQSTCSVIMAGSSNNLCSSCNSVIMGTTNSTVSSRSDTVSSENFFISGSFSPNCGTNFGFNGTASFGSQVATICNGIIVNLA